MLYYGFAEKDKSVMKYLGTEPNDLQAFNNQGLGIFWCYNMNEDQEYEGKREKARVTDGDIRTFFVDLDDGTKDEMWGRIIESPLIPSQVIETSRGFHVYWFTDSATLDTFEDVQKRLIDYYNGDTKCKDVVRLLRVPGFKQYKRNDGFIVELVWHEDVLYYSDLQMQEAYPMSRDMGRVSVKPEQTFTKYASYQADGMLSWNKLNDMDQGELLLRLSGSGYVNGEVYSLTDNANGTRQIVIGDKSSGCFVNGNGDIIADRGYSNNVFNWLRWLEYGLSDSEIYEAVRIVVPEVFRN